MIDKILNLIRKPKGTAAEYREALAAIDLKAAAAAVEILEAQRRDLLLMGSEQQIEEIETKLRQGNREVDRLHAASDELKRLIGEAETAEANEALEVKAMSARANHRGLMLAYVALDEAAFQFTESFASIQLRLEMLQDHNRAMSEHGRKDLMLQWPLNLLGEHLKRDPLSLPRGASDGTMTGWNHPDGRLLARMKEIIPEGDS